MIIEQMVEQILRDGGMLDPWIDVNGDTQPVPQIQLITFREEDLLDERGIIIRESGSIGGDVFGQKVAVSIYFVGLKDVADSLICKARAKQLQDLFFLQQAEGDIITVNPQSFSLPVMYTASSRPIVNIELEVLTDRGFC